MLARTTFPLLVPIMAALLLSGCATERFVSPALSDGPRTGLEVKPPVLAVLTDARTEPMPPRAAIELQADLARIYGPAIEWKPDLTATPSGRVSLRMRIVSLGAYYGKRLLSMKDYTDMLAAAHQKATDTWEPVLGSISGRHALLAGSLPAEGWWNGIARIDLEIEDNRGPQQIRFVVPVAAEHREAGRGSASGDLAALTAWEQAANRLTTALDNLFRVLRTGQQDQSK